MDVANSIAEALPSLNSAAAADLVFWTETDLYTYADEAAKRLARLVGGFVERDASQNVTATLATYSLPTRHLSTVDVAAAGVSLVPTTIEELDALKDNWEADTADPVRFFQSGLEQIRLHPTPDTTAGVLAIVGHFHPATIASGASTLRLPAALQEYFTFAVIREARGLSAEGAMPEMERFFAGVLDLFDAAIGQYWGGAQ